MPAAHQTTFWDKAARKYAASRISDPAGYERSLARMLEILKADDLVAEIGCGTGTTGLRIAPHVGHISASDVSGEMIAIAREKAQAQGCSNIAFAAAPADADIAGRGSAGAVLALNVLHLLDNRPAVYKAIDRALKPGGLFVSKTTCLSEMNPLIRIAVPLMQWIGKAPYVDFFRAEDLEAEIAAAGFQIIETARHGSGKRDARIFIVARKPEAA